MNRFLTLVEIKLKCFLESRWSLSWFHNQLDAVATRKLVTFDLLQEQAELWLLVLLMSWSVFIISGSLNGQRIAALAALHPSFGSSLLASSFKHVSHLARGPSASASLPKADFCIAFSLHSSSRSRKRESITVRKPLSSLMMRLASLAAFLTRMR